MAILCRINNLKGRHETETQTSPPTRGHENRNNGAKAGGCAKSGRAAGADNGSGVLLGPVRASETSRGAECCIGGEMSNRPKRVHTIESLHERCKDVGDCWEWAQGCNNKTHPSVRHDGKTTLVRRLVVQLSGLQIPQGHIVAAICNNWRCINPEHLVTRTESAHMALFAKTGGLSDFARVAKIAATKRAKYSKLTDEKVAEIRASNASLTELSEAYGVNPSRICGIRKGHFWKDYSSPFSGMAASLMGLSK